MDDRRTIIVELNLMMLGYIRLHLYFDGKTYRADFDGVPDGVADVLSDTKILSHQEFEMLYDFFIEASKDTNSYDSNVVSQYSVYIGTSNISDNQENQIDIEYDSTDNNNFSPERMQDIMNRIAIWGGLWENLYFNII